MALINLPNTFSSNTTISSSQMNANFSTIVNDYNGSISAANLAADAVTTAKIADSNVTTGKIADTAVTPAKLLAGTGTTWAWQDWTPTFTNLSGGTLTYAKYTQIGKTVHFRFKYVLGGAGVAGGVDFTLPVTEAAAYSTPDIPPIGTVIFRDAGTAIVQGFATWASTGKAAIRASNAAGTYTILSSLSSTVPFTWTSTDEIQVLGTYEAA